MLTHPQPPKGAVKAWHQGKHNLHKGQEMEKSRVKVPPHSSPNHPCYIQNIPSQESSQEEQEWSYPYRVPESKPQLHPPPGELHWGKRKEE